MKRKISNSIVLEWMVQKELEKLQMKKLAENWKKDLLENENTNLWLKLRDEKK